MTKSGVCLAREELRNARAHDKARRRGRRRRAARATHRSAQLQPFANDPSVKCRRVIN